MVNSGLYYSSLTILSLALSEALINIYKNHKSEGSPTSGYQNHQCKSRYQKKVVLKIGFLLHLSFYKELHLFYSHCLVHGKTEEKPLDIGIEKEKILFLSTKQPGPCKIRLTKDRLTREKHYINACSEITQVKTQ